jgi:hypothetical protein
VGDDLQRGGRNMPGKRLGMDHLYGSRDVAAHFKVTPSTVYRWAQRYTDFPKPVAKINGFVLVWARQDILGWSPPTARLKKIRRTTLTRRPKGRARTGTRRRRLVRT